MEEIVEGAASGLHRITLLRCMSLTPKHHHRPLNSLKDYTKQAIPNQMLMVSSMATSVRWHQPLFVAPKPLLYHHRRRSLAQQIRAFGRSDLDGFARRVASGEAFRDAWRSANDGIEILAFEARKAAERIDHRFAVSRRFDSFARAATARAREVDQELGIARRLRTFSMDFSRNWPRVRVSGLLKKKKILLLNWFN